MNEAQHGTRGRYNGSGYSPGCRCIECRDANAVYQREWRIKAGLTAGGRRKSVKKDDSVPATCAICGKRLYKGHRCPPNFGHMGRPALTPERMKEMLDG